MTVRLVAIIWALSWENLSLGFCNQLRLKLACSATGASQKLDILDIETKSIIQAANNKGADKTARMHRLICAFAVRICHKQVSSRRGSYSIRHTSAWKPIFLSQKSFHRLICAFVVRIWQKQVFSWHGSFATIKKNIFTFSCALCMSSLDAWTRCNEQLPDAQAIFCMAFIVLRSGTTLVAWKYNILNSYQFLIIAF